MDEAAISRSRDPRDGAFSGGPSQFSRLQPRSWQATLQPRKWDGPFFVACHDRSPRRRRETRLSADADRRVRADLRGDWHGADVAPRWVGNALSGGRQFDGRDVAGGSSRHGLRRLRLPLLLRHGPFARGACGPYVPIAATRATIWNPCPTAAAITCSWTARRSRSARPAAGKSWPFAGRRRPTRSRSNESLVCRAKRSRSATATSMPTAGCCARTWSNSGRWRF